MSMLTPPGMGGKYRITGNQYPRMRRPRSRRRIVAAAVATVVVLGLIGYGTLQLIDVFGGKGSDKGAAARVNAAQKQECKTSARPSTPAAQDLTPTVLPKPDTVTINVYNATSKSGLAKDTADELAARGFRIGTFGNAPGTYDKKVAESALLLGGTQAAAAIKVVSAYIPGTTTSIDPKRTGTTVDLMIGTSFTKLSGDAAVRQALKALASPSPAASPSGKTC